MEEASVSNSAASLRSLFAVILTWCEPNNPLDIYEYHKESMAFNVDIFNLALNDLQDKVFPWGVGSCLTIDSGQR